MPSWDSWVIRTGPSWDSWVIRTGDARTLSKKISTTVVPYLADLDRHGTASEQMITAGNTEISGRPETSMRRSWKTYVSATLPHASRQIQNFLLACVAEGRTHDDEEEEAHRRGTTLTCSLTQKDITEIISGHRQQETSMDTSRPAQQDSSRPAQASDQKKKSTGVDNTAKRMAATTSLAMQLAERSILQVASTTPAVSPLSRHCRTKVHSSRAADDMEIDGNTSAAVGLSTHNWRDAYAAWISRINNNESGIVPNTKQKKILEVVHERCATERCHEDGTTDDPLLRLVHGLPGSGKSGLWAANLYRPIRDSRIASSGKTNNPGRIHQRSRFGALEILDR